MISIVDPYFGDLCILESRFRNFDFGNDISVINAVILNAQPENVYDIIEIASRVFAFTVDCFITAVLADCPYPYLDSLFQVQDIEDRGILERMTCIALINNRMNSFEYLVIEKNVSADTDNLKNIAIMSNETVPMYRIMIIGKVSINYDDARIIVSSKCIDIDLDPRRKETNDTQTIAGSLVDLAVFGFPKNLNDLFKIAVRAKTWNTVDYIAKTSQNKDLLDMNMLLAKDETLPPPRR